CRGRRAALPAIRPGTVPARGFAATATTPTTATTAAATAGRRSATTPAMTHHPGYPPPPGAPAGQPAPPGSHAVSPGSHAVPPGAHPAGTATNSARIVIGLLLVVPAAIALLLGYAIPTGRTFITSFQDRPPLAGTESRFVGVENYRQVAGEFPGSVGLAVLTIAVPLLGLLVVAPLLAWLAHRAGTAGRRIARLALTFPV